MFESSSNQFERERERKTENLAHWICYKFQCDCSNWLKWFKWFWFNKIWTMQSENFQCTFTFGLYHHFSCIHFRIQKQKDALDKWLEKSKCEYILALKGLEWKIEFTPIEHVLQLNFTLKIVHFRFSFKQMPADFFHTIFFCMLQINSKFFFFISELDSVHCFLCQQRQLFHL